MATSLPRWSAWALAAMLVACGGGESARSPNDPPSGKKGKAPTCLILAKTCDGHDTASVSSHDSTTATVKACHELGRAAPSNEQCEAKLDECLAACTAYYDH